MSERFGPIDFDRFHTVDLPERLAAGNGKLAGAHLSGLRPIAFRLVDGRAFTYIPTTDGIDIAPGDEDASTVVEPEGDGPQPAQMGGRQLPVAGRQPLGEVDGVEPVEVDGTEALAHR